MAITRDDVLNWVKNYAQVIAENDAMLTELDRQIGDSDHGANMHRGFDTVLKKLVGAEDKDITGVLKTVGMALLGSVGGAGGPLYSTLFMQAAKTTAGKTELELADWHACLQAGFAGIVSIGKAQVGDKTMLDALAPAIEALQVAIDAQTPLAEALQKSAQAAHEGMLATIPLVARKGRASYLGERSAGHQDPGATSTFLLLDTAAKTWAGS